MESEAFEGVETTLDVHAEPEADSELLDLPLATSGLCVGVGGTKGGGGGGGGGGG
jgi:hypothetical protein